jgi:RNA polymerase sigma factor (sigma-70 family)
MSLKMDIQQSGAHLAEEKQALSLDIEQAIARLPKFHRLAVMLRYAEDVSTDDIASALNRPAGTIRRILSESYRMLRLYLQKDVKS